MKKKIHYLQNRVKANEKGATTLGITTFNMMTLSIKVYFATVSINYTQHNNYYNHYAE